MVTEATVVVFDVNVYLDVASLLGPPFTWDRLREKAREVSALPVPSVEDERIDSIRAVSYCLDGQVVPGEALEVWTSAAIDELVYFKAIQPTDGATPEDRGLGWAEEDAGDLLEGVVRDLVYDFTTGSAVEGIEAHSWAPPLSHEDGRVFQTAFKAGDDELSPRICVTRDEDFRLARGLPPRVDMMYPHEFVQYIRDARRPPPGSGPAGLIRVK